MIGVGKFDYEEVGNALISVLAFFGELTENDIDNILAILHYKRVINLGSVKIVQGNVFSEAWRAVLTDLIKNRWIKVKNSGWLTLSLSEDCQLVQRAAISGKLKDVLEAIRRMDKRKRRKTALELHYKTLNVNTEPTST